MIGGYEQMAIWNQFGSIQTMDEREVIGSIRRLRKNSEDQTHRDQFIDMIKEHKIVGIHFQCQGTHNFQLDSPFFAVMKKLL